ncbi:tetratricopeptide repeat protein [Hyphomonas johnsonii]|uniref:Lipoprotein n=1 Tax=Hyphomonas johnsonii MHS-2 TaxID=1280950 RepID=A0A059FQU7_9PROT|nr:hypothetical protein [Hyphomonas johnsonii]KCZ92848.1 hypothetical protein HJO_07832 [Hyphomonas johnsonii MHS-2]
MRNLVVLAGLGLLVACATPGYEYEARIAPNFPQAADYRDPAVGRFRGPAGDVAEAEFDAMLADVRLDGMPWFTASPDGPDSVYEGDVSIDAWNEDVRYERERRCVKHKGVFDCKRHAMVETECTTGTVEVTVTTRLIDLTSNRTVFTASQPGGAARETCIDIAEYPDDGRPEGVYRDPRQSNYNPYNAPIGMVQDAVTEAVRRFRYDIAPYNKTVRAEIMTDGLVPEEQNDARFALAVEATKQGNFIAACTQWDAIAREYPRAPAVLHNQGACAEARGDMETAQARYARAAELVGGVPLLKPKQARPIFDALERVSGRRVDQTVIDGMMAPEGS